MLISNKNIRLIRILLAVLVLTASSGATVVLHRCQMQAPCCCSPDRHANADGCDQPNGTSASPSLKADFTCHTSVVVGGVALKQGLLEKGYRPESNKAVIPSIVSLSSNRLIQAGIHSHNLLLSKAVSPPSLDRYALSDSFLI